MSRVEEEVLSLAEISPRRLDIQGMRGLAVLLVVAFHAGLPLPGGFIGVDVFFVISGFVITDLLRRQWTADGRIDFLDFYVRRIRRLLPALALMVSITSLASLLVQPPNGGQQQTAQTALGAILLSANIVIPRLASDYFGQVAAANPLLHTWSLSAEEQFYLGFPALLLVGLVLSARPRAKWRATLVVAAASAASAALLALFTYAPSAVAGLGAVVVPFYSAVARAWEFGAGALVALSAATFRRWPQRRLLLSGLAGAAAVLASAVLITPSTPFPGVAGLGPVAGAALLLASGVAGSHVVIRALSCAPLVWIGDLSYSWYLWHWPAIVFGRLLFPDNPRIPILGAMASFVVAYLSVRYLENPIRFASPFGVRQLTVLVVASVGTPVLIAAALGLGARAGWGQEWALGAHVVMQRDCDTGPFDPIRCRWSTPGATASIMLLGDSQSWALADGLIPAAASLGYDTIVASDNACPFAAAGAPSGAAGVASPACVVRNEGVLRYALEHPPRAAVIANQSRAYATAYGDKWRASLSTVVKRLRDAGVGVVVVNVAPIADEQATRTSLLIRPAGDRYTSAATQREDRHDANTTDRLVAEDNPGTVLFDPATVLCDEARCRVVLEGTEFYSDQNHLSRSGALLLEPGLREALTRAVAAAAGITPERR